MNMIAGSDHTKNKNVNNGICALKNFFKNNTNTTSHGILKRLGFEEKNNTKDNKSSDKQDLIKNWTAMLLVFKNNLTSLTTDTKKLSKILDNNLKKFKLLKSPKGGTLRRIGSKILHRKKNNPELKQSKINS